MLNLRSMTSDEHLEFDGLKSLEDTHGPVTRFTPLTLGNLGAPLDFNELGIYVEGDDCVAADQSVDCYGSQESTIDYELDDPFIVSGRKASF